MKVAISKKEGIVKTMMRSAAIKEGLERAPHRALLKACGVKEEDLKNLSLP